MQLRHYPNGRKTMHGEILVRHLWERLQQKNPAARAQNGSRQLEPNPTADSWFGLRLVYVTRLVPAPLTRMHRDRNAQTICHSHSDHRRVHSAIAGSELRMWHFCSRHTRILYLHINMNNGHCLIAGCSLYRFVWEASQWVAVVSVYLPSLWSRINSPDSLSEHFSNEFVSVCADWCIKTPAKTHLLQPSLFLNEGFVG